MAVVILHMNIYIKRVLNSFSDLNAKLSRNPSFIFDSKIVHVLKRKLSERRVSVKLLEIN